MLSVEQLLQYNGHLGSTAMHLNTQMGLFVFGQVGKLMVFDLRISILFLRRSISLLRILNLNVARRQIVFIGCHPTIDSLLNSANRFFEYKHYPLFGVQLFRPYFLMSTWLRGCFTNFKKLRAFLCYIKVVLAFAKKFQAEQLSYFCGKSNVKPYQIMPAPHYLRTRWEELLGGRFAGFDSIEYFPSLAINFKISNKIWINVECSSVDLPLVSIIDSFVDPRGISYPIPGNENSIQFIYLILFLFISNIKISILSYYLKFFYTILFEFSKYSKFAKYGTQRQEIINNNFKLLLFYKKKHPAISFFFNSFWISFLNNKFSLFFHSLKKSFFFTFLNFFFKTFSSPISFNNKKDTPASKISYFCLNYFLVSSLFSELPVLFIKKIYTRINNYYRILKKSLNFSCKKFAFHFDLVKNTPRSNKFFNYNFDFSLHASRRILKKNRQIFFFLKHQRHFFFNHKFSKALALRHLPRANYVRAKRSLRLLTVVSFRTQRGFLNKFHVQSRRLFLSALLLQHNAPRKRRKGKYFIGSIRYKLINLLGLRRRLSTKFIKKYLFIKRTVQKSLRFLCINKPRNSNKIKVLMSFKFQGLPRRRRFINRFFRQIQKPLFNKNLNLVSFLKKQYLQFHLNTMRRISFFGEKPLLLNELLRVSFRKNHFSISPTTDKFDSLKFNPAGLQKIKFFRYAAKGKFFPQRAANSNHFRVKFRKLSFCFPRLFRRAMPFYLNQTSLKQFQRLSLVQARALSGSFLRAFNLNFNLRRGIFINKRKRGLWALRGKFSSLQIRLRVLKYYKMRRRKFIKPFFKHSFLKLSLPTKNIMYSFFFRLLKIITLFLILRKLRTT